MGPAEIAGATNFRPTAVRTGVMGPAESASATNFRIAVVRAEVMHSAEIASATNLRPTAVRTGVMGPAKLSLQRGAPTRKRERGESEMRWVALGGSHIARTKV